MPGPLFIGIDGGATHCRARIGDAAGNVLGDATRKASANIASRKPEAVMAVILACVRTAARCAGLAEKEWRNARAGFGLAGADVTSARDELARLFVAGKYFRGLDIRTDAHVTWLGAFGGKNGGILILGTGSCGLAVVKGKESYVSGYGPEISDEASGHWLGRTAIRRALWAHDGRARRTELADRILARFDNSPEEIIKFANGATPAQFGEFAPLVFDYAERGDWLAAAVVNEAASDADSMIVRLLELKAPSVYLHGGISERLSAWLRPTIRERLKRQINLAGVPLDGAILLAQRILVGPVAARG